jgi:hypothetical protein
MATISIMLPLADPARLSAGVMVGGVMLHRQVRSWREQRT